MREIIEYFILKGFQDLEQFVDDMNAAIMEGWQPWGAPYYRTSSNYLMVFQTMVRYRDNTNRNKILEKYLRGES